MGHYCTALGLRSPSPVRALDEQASDAMLRYGVGASGLVRGLVRLEGLG